ncbi:peptidase M14 [Arenibacter sp. 6A1]|uniref:M14 family metallopeptidase n=1 Tax=Arenibacter sp. 6A1 TaxID=2720391 RepID=UPI0014460CB3|nr:M14 metallopeptidase family protein [Arenibacter sp. 6A1]NKI25033.1 peptidase M14 [Arenibacter sp. 6A1]
MSQKKYSAIKEESIKGRYVVGSDIDGYLGKLPGDFKVETIGRSVQDREIKMVTLGDGGTKILMWSQMHGNESTTTKAVLDLLNFLKTDEQKALSILKNCTIKIIPILNPDGAAAYTRVNANQVDLNRDAQQRTQPESVVLRNVYEGFNPDFCFNLHDQRTIFNVGETPMPATVSFLAPAQDEERSISQTRGMSMKLIVAMNQELQKIIPGQVGRYDDGFNSNCIGDTFQMLNTPTILFEAGHYKNDYQREETRRFIYIALEKALDVIAKNEVNNYNIKEYAQIPNNNKLYYDVLINNIHLFNPKYKKGESAGVLFKETLINGEVVFKESLEDVGILEGVYGHKTFNCLNDSDIQELEKYGEVCLLLK